MALKVNKIELSKEPHSKLPTIPLDNCDMIVMKAPLEDTISDARVITHISCGLEK